MSCRCAHLVYTSHVPAERHTVAVGAFDFRRSLVLQRFGKNDPTASLADDRFSKTFHWRGEPVQVELRRGEQPQTLSLHGPAELLESWAPVFPPADGYSEFVPPHDGLHELHRRYRGLRIVRVPWLYDIACSCILQQRVRLPEAVVSWRQIAEQFGRDGAFPSPKQIARLQPQQLRRCGVDHQRARTLIGLAREHAITGFLDDGLPIPELRARLGALAGIGPWTIEMIALFGAGDADAVPVGDWHLSHVVSLFFRGRPRGSDAQMLESLAPFTGQRGRVARLLIARTPKRVR